MFHFTSDIYWKKFTSFVFLLDIFYFLTDCDEFQTKILNFERLGSTKNHKGNSIQWLSINPFEIMEKQPLIEEQTNWGNPPTGSPGCLKFVPGSTGWWPGRLCHLWSWGWGRKFYCNYRSHLPLWEIEMWKLAPVETENTNLNEHILCQETLNRIQMASLLARLALPLPAN